MHADSITKYLISALNETYYQHDKVSGIKIAGHVDDSERKALNIEEKAIEFIGSIPREEMANVYRKADIFFSLEINAACPNSVVEALASGLPVVGMNTGAISELVEDGAGEVANYGADPWLREVPNFEYIKQAMDKVINDVELYQQQARAKAEKDYNIDVVMGRYLDAMKKLVKHD